MKYIVMAAIFLALAGCGKNQDDFDVQLMHSMADKKCASHDMAWDRMEVRGWAPDIATVRCLNTSTGNFLYEVIPAVRK